MVREGTLACMGLGAQTATEDEEDTATEDEEDTRTEDNTGTAATVAEVADAESNQVSP